MTDGELVRRARSGEARALAELMNRWAPRTLALCHVHANRQAAPDLAQESLLRAIRNLPDSNIAISVEDSVPINARLASAIHAHVVRCGHVANNGDGVAAGIAPDSP